METHQRDKLLGLDEQGFLAECEFSMQKRGGKGGQKVNKTSSAVRLLHPPTGLESLASESRRQAENRSIAVKKLRHRMAMEMRVPFTPSAEFSALEPSLGNPVYPEWLAWLLDALSEHGYALGESSDAVGISSGRLVKLLSRDAAAWQKINAERGKRGMRPLRIQ